MTAVAAAARTELGAALAAGLLCAAALCAALLLGCGTAPPRAPPRDAASDAHDASADAARAAVQEVQEGQASFYARKFDGRKTASGERYDPKLMTAAHRSLPFGTRLRVTRAGGPTVVVRVNDRCACNGARIIDLSQAAARKLDMMRAGVVPVRVEVLER